MEGTTRALPRASSQWARVNSLGQALPCQSPENERSRTPRWGSVASAPTPAKSAEQAQPRPPRRGAAAARRLGRGALARRDHEHDGGERVGQGVAVEPLDAVEDLHRRDARHVEDERHAEVGEGPDEDQRAAREEARQDERQRHPAEAPPGARPEVLRHLLERRVELGERGREVEVEDGEEPEGVHRDDPREARLGQPVDRAGGGRQAEEGDGRVERALRAEQVLHADRAHEGRQDHRREEGGRQQAAEREVVPVVEHRQRQRHAGRRRGGGDADEQGVEQALAVDRVAEDDADVVQGQPAPGRAERLLQDGQGRVDEARGHAGRDGDEEDPGGASVHGLSGACDGPARARPRGGSWPGSRRPARACGRRRRGGRASRARGRPCRRRGRAGRRRR